jgi:hypothetical protein
MSPKIQSIVMLLALAGGPAFAARDTRETRQPRARASQPAGARGAGAGGTRAGAAVSPLSQTAARRLTGLRGCCHGVATQALRDGALPGRGTVTVSWNDDRTQATVSSGANSVRYNADGHGGYTRAD